MKTIRALLKLLVVGTLVILPIFYLVKFFVGETIVVDVSSLASIKNSHLFVNGHESLSKNETLKSYRLIDQIGKKSITVKAAGYEDFSASLSVFFRGTKTIKAIMKPVAPNDLASSLNSGFPNKDYVVNNAKYFDNNSWLAFNVISKADNSLTASVMAYFKNDKSSWAVLNYGGEEYEFDINNPAPYIPQPPKELLNEYFGVSL